MKKLLPFLLLLVIAGAFFVFLKNTDDVIIVRSDDGRAELRIPKDAVLSGGTIESITMTAIAPKDFFKESSQPVDTAKVYRLEPDGLTLSEPATISVTFPYDQNKTYSPVFLVHPSKEGAVESLNITDFELDEEGGMLTVSGEVLHFSDHLFNIDAHIFDARHIPEEKITLPVGQSFEHTYIITPGVWEYVTHPSSRDPDHELHVKVEVGNGTRWLVNPDFRSPHIIRTIGRLVPQEIVRDQMDLAATEAYRITNTYTCREVGFDRPNVVGGSWINYTLQTTAGVTVSGKPYIRRDNRSGWVIGRHGPEVDCVAPPREQDSPSADVKSDEQTSPPPALPAAPKTPGGKIIVCGLPGGPACPPR